MTTQVLILVVGFILLIAGAELLVRGSVSLARRFGLTPLVIGLTVVAFGTSAPELVVSVGGAIKGMGDIAVGNVVGSNIFNVAVILGIAALISPVRIKLSLIKIDAPLMIAATVFGAFLILSGMLTRAMGVLMVSLLVGYTVFSIVLARKENTPAVNQEFEAGVSKAMSSLGLDLLFVLGGLGVLILGANFLVSSASTLARSLGVSEAVIGLTIVAAGTSMPELATTVVAAVRGQSDVAVGNIIGSNLFNLLGILGTASVVRPISAPGISAIDVWVMVGYSVALLPLIWTGYRVQRGEGALLLSGYGIYLWYLWPAT